MNSPYRNLELTAAQLERAINGLIKHRDRVTRPTLARWRKYWGFSPPYDHSHIQMLSHYGDLLSLGFNPERAKRYTIEHFESQEQKHEHSAETSQAGATATAITENPATPATT